MHSGGTPAQQVYKTNLPIGIPIPQMPRSPRPNIRPPSVTTVKRTSLTGQLLRMDSKLPFCSIDKNNPLGVSTVGGAFNQQVIENMSAINDLPVIFPYSNPTSHSECTAEQAYIWSKGRAIFASGSPFAPVSYGNKTFTPGQGNNVFIFPALGLAIYATEAKRVTDAMLLAAAEGVAQQVSQGDFDKGLIYPHVNNIAEVSLNVAVKVAEEIFNSGLASVKRPLDIMEFLRGKMFEPVY